MSGKVWQQRFSMELAAEVDALNRSAHFDWRLGPYDLDVSRTWAKALKVGGALTEDDLSAILKGLDQISGELVEKGSAFPEASDEDIHMAIERRLGEIVGEPAEKLHYGRSRNDMVATDILLYIKAQTASTVAKGRRLIEALVNMAEAQKSTAFPGYTHLQQAQVVSMGHILLAHAAALRRDISSFETNATGLDQCPMGAGALGGTFADVDTNAIAQELGFEGPAHNSIDAVASRDAVADFLYIGARLGIHLSRLAEDMILWATQEFGYISLGDNIATGSSLLPHKKNPDVFELARGKSGRLMGNLQTMLTVLKGLPTGYNKDLQEDKEALFDTVETLGHLLPAVTIAINSVTVNVDIIRGAMVPEMKLLGLVQQLTTEGITFRAAYRHAQLITLKAETMGVSVTELSLDDLQTVNREFDASVLQYLQGDWEVAETGIAGGASLSSVEKQIAEFRLYLNS